MLIKQKLERERERKKKKKIQVHDLFSPSADLRYFIKIGMILMKSNCYGQKSKSEDFQNLACGVLL